MQTIERVPNGHVGRSRSCAYADIVYTVATSVDTSLDIVGQTHQALAVLSTSLEGMGSHASRMLSAQVLLAD
ncbi:RidA family protein [Pseudomonas sp. S1_E04]